MKTITLSLLIVFTTMSPLVCCDPCKFLGCYYGIDLQNDADFIVSSYGNISKSTSIPFKCPSLGITGGTKCNSILSETKDWISAMSPTDTLRLFLFHRDSVNYLGWNKIRDDYMVLVRYDLSQEDIYRLGFKIHYPPTEAMKDIHMYPPYEEVLEKYRQMTGKTGI